MEINKLLENLNEFNTLMLKKIVENFPKKGFSWRTMPTGELQDILQNYTINEKWVAVANLAFMLWETTQKIPETRSFAQDEWKMSEAKPEKQPEQNIQQQIETA